MESAFIFGHFGNLAGSLGPGWSVEESYAWAVGYESRLTLPLAGDDKPYVVRFTVHPLINPGVKELQRLIVKAGSAVLGRFTISKREAVEFPLPIELTAGSDRIELTLVHPDAIRPADFQPTSDARWLTLCFHSAGLIREGAGVAADASAARGLDVPTGIVAGNHNASQLAHIVGTLPSLRGKIEIHYVDTRRDVAAAEPLWPESLPASAVFCWLQIGSGRTATVEALRSALSPNCVLRRFGMPEMHAFWPFLAADSRAVREGNRYRPARYRFGDRIAEGLAHANLAGDQRYTVYESATEQEMPDLDALMAVDAMNWKRLDARSDVKLSAYIQKNNCLERLFLAPTTPGPALLRAMAERLLEWPPMHPDVSLPALLAELDSIMEGYAGQREELPVHPQVARHFKLAWWDSKLLYRWHGNRLSFKDYILDYISWAPWRP